MVQTLLDTIVKLFCHLYLRENFRAGNFEDERRGYVRSVRLPRKNWLAQWIFTPTEFSFGSRVEGGKAVRSMNVQHCLWRVRWAIANYWPENNLLPLADKKIKILFQILHWIALLCIFVSIILSTIELFITYFFIIFGTYIV